MRAARQSSSTFTSPYPAREKASIAARTRRSRGAGLPDRAARRSTARSHISGRNASDSPIPSSSGRIRRITGTGYRRRRPFGARARRSGTFRAGSSSRPDRVAPMNPGTPPAARRSAASRCTVVTDSSACLPRRESEGIGIRVLPIELFIGGQEFHGDDDLADEAVAQALAREEPIKSSAPSVSAYLSAVEEAPTDEVVVLTPAREFTRMHDNASVAATDLARAELVAALASLETLQASGRVQAGALTLAKHMGIRPVFRLHDGRVERIGVPRDEDAAIRRIARAAISHGFAADADAVLMHVADRELAERLREELGCDAPIARFSPAMAAHTGLGLVGVAWLRAVGRPTERTS